MGGLQLLIRVQSNRSALAAFRTEAGDWIVDLAVATSGQRSPTGAVATQSTVVIPLRWLSGPGLESELPRTLQPLMTESPSSTCYRPPIRSSELETTACTAARPKIGGYAITSAASHAKR